MQISLSVQAVCQGSQFSGLHKLISSTVKKTCIRRTHAYGAPPILDISRGKTTTALRVSHNHVLTDFTWSPYSHNSFHAQCLHNTCTTHTKMQSYITDWNLSLWNAVRIKCSLDIQTSSITLLALPRGMHILNHCTSWQILHLGYYSHVGPN